MPCLKYFDVFRDIEQIYKVADIVFTFFISKDLVSGLLSIKMSILIDNKI